MNTSIPACVGIIMDGNRRYAKARGIPQFEGHRIGLAKVKELVSWAKDAGVREVVLYGFSTENWNRAPEEVSYLMDLFEETFGGMDVDEIMGYGFRIKFIGQRARFSKRLQKSMENAEMRTRAGTEGTLFVALSYGGRAEILDAVQSLIAKGTPVVDENTLRTHMWSRDMKDPDIIIRTGGDKRLSNFLPWQSVYSELFFTDTYWPAFEKAEFDSILAEFGKRERRHGK